MRRPAGAPTVTVVWVRRRQGYLPPRIVPAASGPAWALELWRSLLRRSRVEAWFDSPGPGLYQRRQDAAAAEGWVLDERYEVSSGTSSVLEDGDWRPGAPRPRGR